MFEPSYQTKPMNSKRSENNLKIRSENGFNNRITGLSDPITMGITPSFKKSDIPVSSKLPTWPQNRKAENYRSVSFTSMENRKRAEYKLRIP